MAKGLFNELPGAETMSTEKYLGTWRLVPELCIYQSGNSPIEGEYIISRNSVEVSFRIIWKDRDGKSHELQFKGFLDGMKHPIQMPGVTDMSCERIDERTLDTTAFNCEHTVMYARRVASNDGAVLAVNQVLYGPEGPSSNFQVYRRASY